MINNQVFFSLRIQFYNNFVNQFDSIDYKHNHVYNFKNEHLIFTTKFPMDSTKSLTSLINLEWNCNQRFHNLKVIENSFYNNIITLRNFDFWIFLDNCLDSLFLDKQFMLFKNETPHFFIVSESSYWFYYFNFLIKKENFLFNKIQITFWQQSTIYSNNLFLSLHWIPHNIK